MQKEIIDIIVILFGSFLFSIAIYRTILKVILLIGSITLNKEMEVSFTIEVLSLTAGLTLLIGG